MTQLALRYPQLAQRTVFALVVSTSNHASTRKRSLDPRNWTQACASMKQQARTTTHPAVASFKNVMPFEGHWLSIQCTKNPLWSLTMTVGTKYSSLPLQSVQLQQQRAQSAATTTGMCSASNSQTKILAPMTSCDYLIVKAYEAPILA
ncbi:hypothetical protein M378DRAFT_182270 [Amanita muscaria Koide BX008]|uniref:Uncharacterized protein n=1 Tax=Amanita muscaria (strain Koide BX008) TaxID=946122 RepID=A0A0C2SMS4_AMAMK|nr:hypothetical protein M378DRAFT_182270 [Amanita muscaria Koide BX008]